MALVPPHTHPRHEHSQYVLPAGMIMMYAGATAPAGWAICDGSPHGSAELQALLGSANTPDLRDKFVLGASAARPRGSTGGAESVTLTAAQSGLPSHAHTASTGNADTNHTHPGSTGYMNQNWAHSHGAAGLQSGTGMSAASGWDGNRVHRFLDYPGGYWLDHGTSATDTNHTHNFETNWQSASGNGGDRYIHGHSVTVNAAAAANASSSHENMPPYWAAIYIIKL